MEFIKKHLYFVIVGAIALIALISYPMFVSAVDEDASAKMLACTNELNVIHTAAMNAGKDDLPKTQAHIDKATEYKKRVDGQIDELLATMKDWTIHQTFTDTPPPQVLEFNDWLDRHRKDMYAKLNAAGIDFPQAAFDALTFDKDATQEKSTDIKKMRPYRIKRMAIMEELVNTLTKKYGKQQVSKFQKIGTETETTAVEEAGLIRIEALTIEDPDQAMKKENEHYAEAYRRSGRGDQTGQKAAVGVDLPYVFDTVEITFVAPLVSVPGVVKALESTDKYHAVVSKLDVVRATSPFPKPEEELKPGPEARLLNTYYREGPVKATVALNIYEFDAEKEKKVRADLNAAPAAPAK